MFRLKANKTSLYKLVGEFENLPPMRQVTITKAYRAPEHRKQHREPEQAERVEHSNRTV